VLVLFGDSHGKDVHCMALCGVIKHYSRWCIHLPQDFEQLIQYDCIKINSAYFCHVLRGSVPNNVPIFSVSNIEGMIKQKKLKMVCVGVM
jgi:hypothetical protein